MGTPHKATPEQWQEVIVFGQTSARDSTILELRSRIEALEAGRHTHRESPDANSSAADVLTDAGCFAGQHGLQGLADADAFWEQQPYGTRLYYGDGVADYLHRDVLRSAIEALEAAASAPADHLRDATEMVATDAELERVFYEAEGTAAADGFRALYNLGHQHGAAQAASSTPEQPPAAPAPTGGLVERLMDEGYAVTHARAAILAAADYMDNHDWPNAARWLREEVQRHG